MAKDFQNALRKTSGDADKSLDARFARADNVLLSPSASVAPEQTPPLSPGFRAETPPTSAQVEVLISVEDLRENPFNPRQYYPPALIEKRAASLLRDGQQYPIQIAPDPEGKAKAVIVDGQYRWLATKHNNGKTIRAVWRYDVDSPLKLYLAARACNVEREDQSAFDDAKAWTRLLEAGEVKDQNELAERLNMKKATLSRTLALASLPEAIVEKMLERHGVGYSAGYEMCLYFESEGFEKAFALAERFVREELSTRELEQIRKAATEPLTRRTRATPTTLKLKVADAQGEFKAFADGRLTVQLKGIPPEQQQALLTWLHNEVHKKLASQ